MAETMHDAYQLEMKLKSNWAAVLQKQTKQFDGFIKKANESTVSLEKSITTMHSNLSKGYEGMFAKGRKQMESMVDLSKRSLTDISTSAVKIFQQASEGQSRIDDLIDRNISKINKYIEATKTARAKVESLAKSDPGRGTYTKEAERYEKIQVILENQIDKMAKYQSDKLSSMLGQHFRKLAEHVLAESSLVAKATKDMVDDALAQWNKVKSLGFMDTGSKALKGAKGISELTKKESQVQTNLEQLRKAQLTQQKAMLEHRALAEKATSEKVKKYHEESAAIAVMNLEKIENQHRETTAVSRKFTEEIKRQREEFNKSSGKQDLLKQWKEQLKPSRVKALMEPMVANVAESGRLAGTGLMKELVKSVERGDQLRGKLDAFKNKIAEIKKQASLLKSAGLIEPSEIVPKIKTVENALKEYEAQIRKTKQEYAKFSPKSMSQLGGGEIGNLEKARAKVNSLIKELPSLGKVTERNFEVINEHVNKIKTAIEDQVKTRRRLEKVRVNIIAEATRIAKQYAETENKDLRKIMRNRFNILKQSATKIDKEIREQGTSSLWDEKRIKFYENKMITSVKQTMAKIRAITSGKTFGGTPDKLFGGIKKQYETLSREIDKLRSRKFVSSSTIAQGKKKVEELKASVIDYKNVLVKLMDEYRRLQRLQRAGFSNQGIRKQKALLKEQLTDMKSHMAEVQRMSHHASRRIEQVQASTLKGFIRKSWEMIRNFRWQVAAIVYLITRAIGAVKRVFFDVMNEIAKFRRDSMALAAQYSFKMFGDMQKNFKQAYNFSRDLMMKLEIVAAETILTLDDMLMLTKTFAQAGIIPRTDEDLHRIATIGTAIKALTEGMANAGVQMKQELYAIIAGRQRATDQLAMMFKLMGKDIQAMIDEGKKTGKEMIEVLADALKPFSVMNEALKHEWEAVINKLEIVWKMLKRFALEDSLLQATKALQNGIDLVWTKAEGLTQLGKEVAAFMKGTFEVAKASVIVIFEIFLQILHSTIGIINNLMTMAGVSSQIEQSTRKMSGNFKALLSGVEFLLKGIWLVKWVIKDILIVFESIISSLSYIVEFTKAAGSYASSWGLQLQSVFVFSDKIKKALREAAEEQRKLGAATLEAANERQLNATNALLDMVKDSGKEYKEIEKTMENILKLLDDIGKGTGKLGQEFKLTYTTGVMDEYAKMQNEMQRAEAAQFKGPKKFEIEAKQKIDALDTLKLRTETNIQDLTKMFKAYHDGVLVMTEKQAVEMQRSWDAHIEVLGGIVQYETFVRNELNRKTAEWYKKEEIALARRQRTYEQFMRDVTQVPMTPEEKAQDWYEDIKIKVKELAVTNEFFAKNIKEVNKALEEGLTIRKENAITQMNIEAEKFINRASKANAWNNVFDDLNIEFAEYIRQVEVSLKLDPKKKEELKKQLSLIKEQRSAQEDLNLAHESYLAQLELQTKKAAFLKGSYSPIKQRQGEIIDLRTTYQREMAVMSKQLDEFNNKWKEQGEWSTDATESIKTQGLVMEETMRQLTIATERELKKKQFPIWNDLVEASNTWADGFTSALSQIVDGVDSVSEALNQLQTQILKDTLKIIIKRTVTDNLQDMLGSEGSIFGFKGIFGGKAGGKTGIKPTEIITKKPLPVYVVNTTKIPEVKDVLKTERISEKMSEVTEKPQPIVVDKPLPTLIVDKPLPTLIADKPLPTIIVDKPLPTIIVDKPLPILVIDKPLPVFVTNMEGILKSISTSEITTSGIETINTQNISEELSKSLNEVGILNTQNISEELSKSLNEVGTLNTQNISKNISDELSRSLNEVGTLNTQNISDELSKTFKEVSEGSNIVRKKINEVSTPNMESISEGSNIVRKKISEVSTSNIEDVSDKIVNATNKISEVNVSDFEGIFDTVASSTNKISEANVSELEAVFDRVASSTNKISEINTSSMESVSEKIVDATNKISEANVSDFEGIFDTVSNSANKISEINTSSMEGVSEKIVNATNKISEADFSELEAAFVKITSSANEISKADFSEFEAVFERVANSTNNISKMSTASIEGVSEKATDIANKIKEANALEVESVSKKVSDIAEISKKANTLEVENFSKKMLGIKSEIEDISKLKSVSESAKIPETRDISKTKNVFQEINNINKNKTKESITNITGSPLPVYVTNMENSFREMMEVNQSSNISEKLQNEMTTIDKTVSVFVTNFPGNNMEVFGGGEIAEKGISDVTENISVVTKEIATNTEKASVSSNSWLTKIQTILPNIANWFSSLFSSQGGAGGAGGAGGGAAAGNFLMGLGRSYIGMAEGGIINEPIVGQGLKSGEIYNFGENTKYGESELVAPMKTLQKSSSRNEIQYHMPINISSIDTQTGIQFILKHSDVIQAQMIKSLRQNKPIRKGIQSAY
jgi:hypothetical protein